MEKILMVYLPLFVLAMFIFNWIIYESIDGLHRNFQKNIIKLGTSTNLITRDEVNYLLLKNDMIVESGKFIPFYNVKILIALKLEYQKFLNFYIKRVKEKELKDEKDKNE